MEYRILILLLGGLFVQTIQHDIKGFDDTVLFDILWPGEIDETEFKDSERITVTSSHQEKYQCILPNIQEKENKIEEKYEGPTGLELLSPLFSQTSCSYKLESYWSYEVCHGRFIRQYHEDREGKKVKLQEYYLGKWNQKSYEKLLSNMKEEETENDFNPPLKKIDNINLPYLEINMENGTLCELNQNKPRITRVLYICYIHGKNEIYSFKETSTCNYEITILTPLLCAHPKYKPKETGDNKINCIPMTGSPNKPYNLLKLKVESLKMRRLSDIDRLRVELIQLDKEDTPDPEFKPVTPVSAVSQLDNFLWGKNCLQGGTGWWKYEFCYGKSVTQYHVDKDGKKISIELGLFNKEAHLAWIKEHPNKQPKPISQRKQLSHFYSGGEICDKTGKPRQTEVKLKCLENSASSNAVSLYLLEPKFCEYILGVESPLICDILAKADENGLVEISKESDEAEDTSSIIRE